MVGGCQCCRSIPAWKQRKKGWGERLRRSCKPAGDAPQSETALEEEEAEAEGRKVNEGNKVKVNMMKGKLKGVNSKTNVYDSKTIHYSVIQTDLIRS